ncbi:MAG: AraC family transcriptional regulator ligand-binding domain-containing protein [Gammaproteobacteria bacterium]
MLNAHGDFVPERTLSVLVRAARRLGITVDLSELAPTREHSGDDTLVPISQYQAVLQYIFSFPRETLGIELAGAMPVEALGLWGFLLRTSRTFEAMLRRAERYSRVFFRYSHLHLSENDHVLTMTCDHPDPSPFGCREQEVCFFLGQWLALGCELIGEAVAVEEVRMRWRGPLDTAPFDNFFNCPLHFGCEDDAMVFHRHVLDLPLPEHTPELSAMFEDYAAAMIHRLDTDATFDERVRDLLSEGLLTGETSEASVAQQLCITGRTLHRRLAESGVSFRQLRQDLLRERAETLLRDGKLPIAEISYLLGYAEPSTFHRAFRNWTGLTPGEWREQQS